MNIYAPQKDFPCLYEMRVSPRQQPCSPLPEKREGVHTFWHLLLLFILWEKHTFVSKTQMMPEDPIINRSLPNGCRLYTFSTTSDERGSLSFLENSPGLPFNIVRTFWIYNIPEGQERGNHAHRTCQEIIIPVHGSFHIEVTDGTNTADIVMNQPEKGLLVPEMIWCRLHSFSPDAVCLCLASQQYDKEGYINEFEQYKHEMLYGGR